MFGLTEEEIAQFGLSFGVGAFMLYMLFIILQLARESKAGRFGTFVLLIGLGFGLVGFAATLALVARGDAPDRPPGGRRDRVAPLAGLAPARVAARPGEHAPVLNAGRG